MTATVQNVTSGGKCKKDAVNENVKLVTKKILQNSNVTRELVEKGELAIIGAYGKVLLIFEVNEDNLEELINFLSYCLLLELAFI